MPYTTFVEGKCYRFRDLKFYAMNGCIVLIDEADGDCRVLTCAEWEGRIKMLHNDAQRLGVINALNPAIKWMFALRNEYLVAIGRFEAALREAQHQGDHFDPQVEAWFARHRPWARSRARMSSHRADFQTPAPGPLPRGPHTGRTATPSEYPRPKSRLLLPASA